MGVVQDEKDNAGRIANAQQQPDQEVVAPQHPAVALHQLGRIP